MAPKKKQVVYVHELLAKFEKEQKENAVSIPESLHAIGYHNGLTMAKSIALKLASDDAAAVVRCQKCMYWRRHSQVDCKFGSCSVSGMTKHEDGFCDVGKEKDVDERDALRVERMK